MDTQNNTPPQDPVGMQFGPYLLRQRLGLGGMASVWKAIDDRGRTLVVKRILPALAEDPEFVEMFVREAALSARMRHPNIVRVFDHGDYEGERYLAMEYLHGKDLTSVMKETVARGAPPAGLGAYVAREVCRALSYVHALTDDMSVPLNLIHRDVSLSNVMLGYDGSVKLLDFGVAKALADERAHRTATGVLKGKWAYLAPEQVDGVAIDQRTDIFSLGIVLHEMLTGRRLFKAPSGLATLEKVRAARVLPPSALNAAVPPALDAVCLRALAKKPGDRFQTAAEMGAALDAAVTGMASFAGRELSHHLGALFPAESEAFHAAQTLTPAGEWMAPEYEDGDTVPDTATIQVPPARAGARSLTPARLEELRVRTGRVTKMRRSRGWRVAMAATVAIALGSITGWQIARSQAASGARAIKRTQTAPAATNKKTSAWVVPAKTHLAAASGRLRPVVVRTVTRGRG
jgi:serine/threonine protein kinase